MRIAALAGVALSSLSLAFGQPAQPAVSRTLVDPVRLQDIRESGGDPLPFIAEQSRQPIEAWRARAMEQAARSGEQARPEDDFAILRQGVLITLRERDLPGEFLRTMDDARVAALFESTAAKQVMSLEDGLARLRLASEVLARIGLGGQHSSAAYELALMTLATSEDVQLVRERFKSASETGPDAHARTLAADALAALTNPTEKSHFAASIHLMRTGTGTRSRLQVATVAQCILRTYRREGMSRFQTDRNEGSLEPLHALARAAVEIGNRKLVREVQEYVDSLPRTASPHYTAARYWTAMAYVYDGQWREALPRFESIAQLGGESEHVAMAALRHAQCLRNLDRYHDALVAYLDVIETHSEHLTAVASAEGEFKWIVNAGLADGRLAHAAHEARKADDLAAARGGADHEEEE